MFVGGEEVARTQGSIRSGAKTNGKSKIRARRLSWLDKIIKKGELLGTGYKFLEKKHCEICTLKFYIKTVGNV